ncbi:MAG: hypothetical protein FD138_3664 [Planctomycetota bacterium]|nr:MAG: hypothetical protein FD138_3664 [Planctomycetota bacterium]
MQNPQNLAELTDYVRKTLPQSNTIANFRSNDKANVIEFAWQSRNFIVKTTLEVMEMKGNNLFITGASMLMQAAFMKRSSNEKVVEAIVNTLQQIEDVVRRDRERGLALLQSVKQTLGRLAGKTSLPH